MPDEPNYKWTPRTRKKPRRTRSKPRNLIKTKKQKQKPKTQQKTKPRSPDLTKLNEMRKQMQDRVFNKKHSLRPSSQIKWLEVPESQNNLRYILGGILVISFAAYLYKLN